MIQFHRYSPVDADRQAAIYARRYLWGEFAESEIIKLLPQELPNNWLLKQEIVCCLGLQLAYMKYKIDERAYKFYQGIPKYEFVSRYESEGEIVYRPRNSGLFSVIENIIVAAFYAYKNKKKFVIDGNGDWWNYKEDFSSIFGKRFHVRHDAKPNVDFDKMRQDIFEADEATLNSYMNLKIRLYEDIASCIREYLNYEEPDRSCVFFVRGGDKLMTETILPPKHTYKTDMTNAGRRHTHKYLLSDDYELAKSISALGGGYDHNRLIFNITPIDQKGYVHGQVVSCLPILTNYMMLINCEESVSCPSANLVNAAHWTRKDEFIHQTYNPVYRYALI